MKSLFSLLVCGILFFLVVGWFMDWYSITGTESKNGKTQFQFEVDRTKINQDIGKAKDKLDSTLDQFNKPKSGTTAQTGQSDAWNWKR